jgi:hypothetical protein
VVALRILDLLTGATALSTSAHTVDTEVQPF